LPPTLHFEKPNPKFDLENSPFYVNTKKTTWKPQELPRRAGVSAFGVGGTNAHVILEEPPAKSSQDSTRPAQLLVLSARSEHALEKATDNLVEHLKAQPELFLPDVAWTLQVGRRKFSHRRSVVVGSIPEAIEALSKRDRKRVQNRKGADQDAPVYFLFPGQGSQHLNMGRQVYESEPVFREALDRCCEILRLHLGEDLLPLLYPPSDTSDSDRRRVTETVIAQPAIFAIEYALAQLWMSWGIRPQAMLGHSVGEFVAACLAGVFNVEDALTLVASRGRIMQQVAPGGMLSVRLAESEVRARLNGHLAIAAVNAPHLCVVAGPFEALDSLEAQLKNEGVPARRLVTSHAFHSPMMDPVVDQFLSCVTRIRLRPPQIPVVSSVSGTWISEREATDPTYWARHLRAPVQFSRGVQELLRKSAAVLLEVGPGNVLSTLAKQHVTKPNDSALNNSQTSVTIVSSFSDPSSGENSSVDLLNAVGAVWAAGVQPNWQALHNGERRQRVPLPTYPFDRKRFWLDAPASQTEVPSESQVPMTQTVCQCRPVQETQQVTQHSESPTLDRQATGDRAATISSTLAEIFADLSGVKIEPSDASSTFLEMGFDSLFLTQVTQALHNKFGLKITFRQLLGDQSSLKLLTEFIDSQLPADAIAQKELPARGKGPSESPVSSKSEGPSLTTEEPSGSSSHIGATLDSAVERLMREQMQTMNQLFAQQLQALKGASLNSSAASNTRNELAGPAAPGKNVVASAATPVAQEPREFKPFGPYKPPQKGTSGQLTERQQHHVRDLIDRCTKRTPKSKSMTQQFRSRLADPRVVSGFRTQWKEMVYPILTLRSKGSRLWDVDGNEYIDILNGFGPIMLGHRPDFVERAVEKQLHEGFEIGPQTPLAGEVAEMFCEMTGNERMSFCNTGSEAVIAALRVARTVTGRSKVVLFAGAYHGMFDEVLVRAVKGGDTPRSLPIAPGIPRESVGNVVVLDYGTPESLEWIRTHARELAAVLVEPVQSRHPNLQPREFLREIREITQASGAALIFDEVVTGFRVDPGGCQALFNIRADLATYGKVLAGGMPIGVLAGKAQFMDALDGGAWQFGDDSYPSVGVTFFAGTFVRHPLTLAAVKAVLEHFREQGPQLQRQLTSKTASLVATLNSLFEKADVPARVETFGSIFYFSFPADFPLGSLLYYHLREKGIYILEGFPCFLTTQHSDADIAKIIRAFDESIREMQSGGIFSERSVLAAHENQKDSNLTAVNAPSLPPEDAPTIEVPMTEPQKEIWLSAQLGDDASCAFNESFTLLMQGQLDSGALRASLQDLVNRHEVLRATIVPEHNSLHFSSSAELSVPFDDLSAMPVSQRTAALESAKQQEASTPFDLINGPVMRLRLFRLEPQLHALIFTSHHIICDGWSTNVLLDELSALYTARGRAAKSTLPAAMRFSEYARQQSQNADTPEVAAYWLKRFEQIPPVLELPTDRPRPAVKSFKGATYRARIDSATYKQIRQAGAKQGCTLFATLFTGFASLLHRLTSQSDIVIGIPTAGQSQLEGGNNLVGHCVNFLPIRVRLIEGQSAAELLQQVKRTLLDAYDHQTYTYGTLIRNLQLRRDPSRLPLIEVQFNLEKVGANLNFADLRVEVDPNPKASVNFDLFVNVVESEKGLLIDCDYNSDLFERETIARWLTHFETLLKSLAANIGQDVDLLPILTDAELHKIVYEWNATAREYPRHKCVHELFEAQVAQRPDAIAVTFEGHSLTYAQLDKRANQLARHLIKVGVTPGSLIGIALDRSLDLLVGLLGIWKAGAAYLPLDAAYPRDRIAFIMEETSLATLVTHSKLVPHLPILDTRPICLDRDWLLIEREPETPPGIELDSSSLAYTIFTSGSTGKPKGVEVTHRNVANLLWSMRTTPGLSDRDRLLAVTTLSFDIAGLELFLPLITGAQIVLASRETAHDPRLLVKLLNESKATVMQATPATWRLLLEMGWTGLPGLRMLCGGEALPRKLANELVQRGELWNMYGPTETTIWSATSRVEAGEGPVPIGPPIHNTQFYVFDSKQQPLPIGVPGELYIGGDGVAAGYFRNAQLTAERFVSNPLTKEASDRLYKTGDLVRYRPDGTLEFLGRLDNQVKVRGFRIELGEIESVLSRNSNVRECVVATQQDESGGNRLVAYCVPQNSEECSPENLRNWVASFLPEYMVPSVFVLMPALPHTPNGKVDRKSLVRLDALSLPEQNLFIAPRTAVETKLAAVCAEVLRLDRLSVHDSLFDLGADSIHLFQIIARAASVGIILAPQQILRSRTVAAIAAETDAGTSENGSAKRTIDKIARVSREHYQLDAAPQAT
jgi:amino acid adenylation domain-containing protein